MTRKKTWMLVLALSILSAPAWGAQQSSSTGLRLRGWGPRVGLADSPDQVVGGVHFDLGDIVDRLRFEPNFELGVGDDFTTLSGTAPVHYLFPVNANVQPYAGGGVTLAWFNHDDGPGRGDDDDVELGVKAIGGVQWRLRSGNDFFLELNLGFGDIHDVQAMAGWTF